MASYAAPSPAWSTTSSTTSFGGAPKKEPPNVSELLEFSVWWNKSQTCKVDELRRFFRAYAIYLKQPEEYERNKSGQMSWRADRKPRGFPDELWKNPNNGSVRPKIGELKEAVGCMVQLYKKSYFEDGTAVDDNQHQEPPPALPIVLEQTGYTAPRNAEECNPQQDIYVKQSAVKAESGYDSMPVENFLDALPVYTQQIQTDNPAPVLNERSSKSANGIPNDVLDFVANYDVTAQQPQQTQEHRFELFPDSASQAIPVPVPHEADFIEEIINKPASLEDNDPAMFEEFMARIAVKARCDDPMDTRSPPPSPAPPANMPAFEFLGMSVD